MENNNKSNKILIVLLILLAFGLAGYYVYDTFLEGDTNTNNIEDNLNNNDIENSAENSTENNTNNSVKKEDNLVLEETFDYYLNNSMHKITYKYYYNKCDKNRHIP